MTIKNKQEFLLFLIVFFAIMNKLGGDFMASNKRYKLVASQGSKEKVIPILNRNENDVKNHLRISTNNHLPTIDLHTINFENEQEFLKGHRHELKLAGIDINKKVYVKIAYQANLKRHVIDPVYKDEVFLKEFALGTETNVSWDKIKGFINSIKDELYKGASLIDGKALTFREFLIENKLIDQRVADLMKDVTYNSDDYQMQQLETELQRYKVVRRILLGLKNYQKDKKYKLFDYEQFTNKYKEMEQMSIFDLMKEGPDKGLDKDEDGDGKKLTKK